MTKIKSKAITIKDVEELQKALEVGNGKPDKMLVDNHTLDAFKYALSPFPHLGLKQGDWVLFNDELAIVQTINFKGVFVCYITGLWADSGAKPQEIEVLDYKKLKKVPKNSTLDSARILYGSSE